MELLGDAVAVGREHDQAGISGVILDEEDLHLRLFDHLLDHPAPVAPFIAAPFRDRSAVP
jgi:hypothetical protein